MSDLREILFTEILKAINYDKNIYLLDCDVGKHTKLNILKQSPHIRYINLGICEQNAIGIAAGISSDSKNIAIVSSFAEFIVGRCWEQIKHSVVYNNSHAIIVGTHSGFSSSEDGASHQCFEDISLIMSIAEIEVYCPAFQGECVLLAKYIMKNNLTPMYIKLSHGEVVEDVKKDEIFDGYIKKESQEKNILVISTGYITHEVIKAVYSNNMLIQKVSILHMTRLRPINQNLIIGEIKKHKKIITIEEHILTGGLYSIVRNICTENYVSIEINNIAIKEGFGQSGSLEELRRSSELSSDKIYNKLIYYVKEKTND